MPAACEGRFGLEWNFNEEIEPGAMYGDLAAAMELEYDGALELAV